MDNNFDYTPQNGQSSFESHSFYPIEPLQTGHAKGYATASMWLGIASVFCTCCCCCMYMVAPVLSIIAIVMACLARRDNGKRMPGMAIAGLIMAIIGLIVFAIILAYEIMFLTMPDAELQELIRKSFENSYGISFEEYVKSIANG